MGEQLQLTQMESDCEMHMQNIHVVSQHVHELGCCTFVPLKCRKEQTHYQSSSALTWQSAGGHQPSQTRKMHSDL